MKINNKTQYFSGKEVVEDNPPSTKELPDSKHSPTKEVVNDKHSPTKEVVNDKHSPTKEVVNDKHSPTKEAIELQPANYCGMCGYKFDNQTDKYCPDCGEERMEIID